MLKESILEFGPNKRLSYTWDAETMAGEKRITHAVVTWTLESLPDGKTSVTLVHSGVAKRFSEDAERGWNYYLRKLVVLEKVENFYIEL